MSTINLDKKEPYFKLIRWCDIARICWCEKPEGKCGMEGSRGHKKCCAKNCPVWKKLRPRGWVKGGN